MASVTDRQPSRESENEDVKKVGDQPRPASEPKGSEGSSNSQKTRTDPATGAPN